MYCNEAAISETSVSGNSVTVTNVDEPAAAGGLALYSTPTTLESVTVSGNNATQSGSASTQSDSYAGGIAVWFDDVSMVNVTVADNIASGKNNAYGGGIYFFHTATGVSHSTIVGNEATGAEKSYGGGVYEDCLLYTSDAADES